MPCTLVALCVDAHDPAALARFWSDLLGWQAGSAEVGGVTLSPSDDTGFDLRFQPGAQPKLVQNQMHFDLTSRTPADQQATVARAIALGARHVDVGQRPEEGHVVLADPEGNEFCVIEAGNAFLADCGFIGAIASDGSQDVGYFWSHALGWPLVWDQDQETAIRSPDGGPKITWGGPPLAPKTGKYRLHFDIAPTRGSEVGSELERLISLGATRATIASERADQFVLLDPDGHEFCLRLT